MRMGGPEQEDGGYRAYIYRLPDEQEPHTLERHNHVARGKCDEIGEDAWSERPGKFACFTPPCSEHECECPRAHRERNQGRNAAENNEVSPRASKKASTFSRVITTFSKSLKEHL